MKIQELDIDAELKSQLLDAVSEKKTFGLVWEEKEEDAQKLLREQLPVFVEDDSKRIVNNDDAPNHVIIEGDNLHALTALSYSHEGKFDAIYIDPPYNSGATDWKYNNDYVDKDDEYRHSKWLDMMKHRLDIAKKLLNPDNSVLIVTIDEKEYLHLGCLLEEMFPNGRMQMISTVINPSGVSRGKDFYRTDEYIYFVKLGESGPCELTLSNDWLTAKSSGKDSVRWRPVRRQGAHDTREDAPNQFYPIFLSGDGTHFVDVGESLPVDLHPDTFEEPTGLITLWPMKPDGTEGCWQISQGSIRQLFHEGFISVSFSKKWGYTVKYLAEGERKKVKKGIFPILGRDQYGTLILDGAEGSAPFIPGTQWRIPEHSAREYGTSIVTNIVGRDKFSFPKSIFAVHDTLRFFVDNNPNAKILDFFAGSGTTLHATMMLNEADDGNRQCFLVSNDESNICEDVTYERNKRVIQGYKNLKGEFVEGLHHNNLRFYRTEFVPRDLSATGQKNLMLASTDLLCIKNDLYDEKDMFGDIKLRKHIARYFDDGTQKMLIVYKIEAIESLVEEMAKMPEDIKIKVYVFSTNNYAMDEDFEEVADKVELYAMPAALCNAYKKVLPRKKNNINEEEDNA